MGSIVPTTVIGMDIGLHDSWCEARNTTTGPPLKKARLPNRPEEFRAFVEELPRPIRVVMEATGNWAYLYECWEPLVEEVQLAHPLKTKAIASARIKTDKIDTSTLTHLGLADLVPQAYIPPREVRDLRDVLRHRAFLVRLQTRVKNRIHSALWKLGLEHGQTDLFGKAGMAWLQTVELRAPFRTLVDQDLRVLASLQQELKAATKTVNQLATTDPRVAWLLPIRGIGKYSALLILAEIGEITRFPDPKKLVAFAGLCPSTHQSGRVTYHGRLTKQGSTWLRWTLVEAAQRYAKAPGRLGSFYRRLARKKGPNTAKVAVARELLVATYQCLHHGVVFQEHPPTRVMDKKPPTPQMIPGR